MLLIGRYVWKLNMVGTLQSNRIGDGPRGVEGTKEELTIGDYNSLFYQHKTEFLTYSIWADNNYVKILSNFHLPIITVGGLNWKRRINGQREMNPTAVDCPEQMKDYSKIIHQIDRGNGDEAKCMSLLGRQRSMDGVQS